MEVCELISLLKKYPEDMEVYLSVDSVTGVCRSVTEDMDYCIFLCDEYREEYGIGLTDDMQLVRYPL